MEKKKRKNVLRREIDFFVVGRINFGHTTTYKQ